MFEGIGDKIAVNAELEHSQDGIGNDVMMIDSEVRSSEVEMLIDDAKDKAVTCSKVDPLMKAKPTDMDVILSDKSFDGDGGEDGKAKMEEMTEAGSKKFSGSKNMCALAHNQDVVDKNADAEGCENVSLVTAGDARQISVKEENAEVEIVKTDTSNGNFSCVEHEAVDGKAKQTVERNGGTRTSLDMVTASQDADVGKSLGDRKLSTDLLTDHDGSVVMAPAQDISSKSVDAMTYSKSVDAMTDYKPTIDFATPNYGGVHPVFSTVGDLVVPDSGQSKDASEQIIGNATVTSSVSQQDVDEDPVDDAEESEDKEGKNSKHVASRLGPLTKKHRATYDLQPETADGLSIYDLVWAKVKSHPWWPGLIFHPSDSSEKAMKYYRKDCYLIAYFGDKSFAWNEASKLKPFRSHFSQEEKQSSSEAFQNAVDCALEEISRRVELGLACSCIPEETYEKIKFQIVENAGIQKDSSKREGGDRFTSTESFQPDKLMSYVRNLARLPTCGANRLELATAKAQLLSFYRLQGCYSLPEFQLCGGLLENDIDTSPPQANSVPSGSELADSVATDDASCTVRSKGPKRKHNLKDIVYHRRKEKSFSEIMGESQFYYDEDYGSDEKHDGMLNSPLLGRKRKVSNFLDDESMVPESTQTISLAKVSQAAIPSPRQSFKIGDCIRRVASQLTGSPSTLKSDDDGNKQQSGHDFDKPLETPQDTQNGKMVISTEQTSPDEFLWELHLTAQDPMKRYDFTNSFVGFFSDFRDAVVSAQHRRKENSSVRGSGRKRKSSLSTGGTPKTFEFDDRKDSFWTDMVVQNNSEDKQPSRRSRKRKDHQLGTGDPEKPAQSTLRRHSRKQYFQENHELTAEKSSADEVKRDQPTELILNFGDISCVPSEANLNKMFRRFGPLKESETEIDRQNSRARVVFKNGSDAEVAYSSAATINIFGPVTVNYELCQIPSISSHSSALALANCMEDAS